MSVTTEDHRSFSQNNDHDWCLLCGERNPLSLKLVFKDDVDGSVSTILQSNHYLQGYKGIMHGGVIAALLDAAMTHCLFHRKAQALTCDLQVRYVNSIPCEACLEIRAWISKATTRLFRLRAEALCDDKVMAWAEGKFLPQTKAG